jgi:hypothetical protein
MASIYRRDMLLFVRMIPLKIKQWNKVKGESVINSFIFLFFGGIGKLNTGSRVC